MLAGAAWGFIPGFLKAVSGAHEVVTTIMLNYIAGSVLAWPGDRTACACRSRRAPVTYAVGNAAYPILIGRNGHLGILIALAAVVRRLVAAVPDDARLRDPHRRRKPGRGALRRDAAAAADHPDDDDGGLLAGLAGAGVVLGVTH